MTIKLCYFNEHWNIYMYSKPEYRDEWVKNIIDTTVIPFSEGLESGEYRLRQYSHPEIPCLYSFGIWYYEPKRRPGHGGEWSSRSEVVNPVFGKDLYEVALDQRSIAVSLKWLKEQLGDGVIWSPYPIWGEVITSVVGEDNIPDKWITI